MNKPGATLAVGKNVYSGIHIFADLKLIPSIDELRKSSLLNK